MIGTDGEGMLLDTRVRKRGYGTIDQESRVLRDSLQWLRTFDGLGDLVGET